MTPTTALLHWLRDDPALELLVNGRIYQGKLPQSPDYPALILNTVSEPRRYHQRGEVGLVRTRLQIDAYAQEASGSDAKGLVDGVAAVVNARVSARSFVQGDVRVFVSYCDNKIDNFEEKLLAHRVLLEYVVWSARHKE
jgi:hypothetical protein